MDTVMVKSGSVRVLLGSRNVVENGTQDGYTGVTADTTGTWQYKDSPFSAYQAVVTGTGAVTATVNIEASLDGENAVGTVLGTITLTADDVDSDGFAIDASPYKYVRAVLTNLTGTGASCYVLQGS